MDGAMKATLENRNAWTRILNEWKAEGIPSSQSLRHLQRIGFSDEVAASIVGDVYYPRHPKSDTLLNIFEQRGMLDNEDNPLGQD